MLNRLFSKDRRREARLPQDCDVLLFRDGRQAGCVRLKDLSASGARLLGPQETILGAQVFVIPKTAQGYAYQPVHSGFGGVGVRITEKASLKGYAGGRWEPIRRALKA